MNKFLIIAALLLVPSPAFSLTSEESDLIGEWTAGGAGYNFKDDGTAVVNSGVCSVNIKWSVKDNQMSVQYLTPPECVAKEPYSGRIIKETRPSLPPETVRIEVSSIGTPGGFATKQLKVFGGKSPNGAVFVRTTIDMPESHVQDAEKDPKCKEFDLAAEMSRCKSLYSDPEALLQCTLKANMEMARCL